MAQPYITIEAPSASELSKLVDDVPIRDAYIEEKLGGTAQSVTVHSSALDDPENLMDEIVEHSSVKASMISID